MGITRNVNNAYRLIHLDFADGFYIVPGNIHIDDLICFYEADIDYMMMRGLSWEAQVMSIVDYVSEHYGYRTYMHKVKFVHPCGNELERCELYFQDENVPLVKLREEHWTIIMN